MNQYDNIMQLMGSIAVQHAKSAIDTIACLGDAEFRVFSQFGDDGIIQYLIRTCMIAPNERRFVEFGTENYTESNTRFLLIHDNWSGLVMDPSQEHVTYIKSDPISWRHDLQALCCFVTPDNINAILRCADFDRDLGIFSIDIDGMDYWVWKSLNIVEPVIVTCEYNSIFGACARIVVPYQADFDRRVAHHSTLYGGASLGALVQLGSEKGYCFVGSNTAGNNAYFVRKDRVGDLQVLSCEQGYVESKFRESRDEGGRLTYARGPDRVRLIADMPVYDLDTGSLRPLRDVL